MKSRDRLNIRWGVTLCQVNALWWAYQAAMGAWRQVDSHPLHSGVLAALAVILAGLAMGPVTIRIEEDWAS